MDEKEVIECLKNECDGEMEVERKVIKEDGKQKAQNIYKCKKCGYIQYGASSSIGFN